MIAVILVYYPHSIISRESGESNFRIIWNVYRYDVRDRGVVGKYGWQRGYTIEIEETAIISSIYVELRWIDRLDFHGLIFSWNWTDKMHMNVDIPELNFS